MHTDSHSDQHGWDSRGAYSDFGPGGSDPSSPRRTSVLAIASVVLGVLCLPGFGAIGVLLGVAALFLIARSNGRVIGAGFAATGIILGLIATTMWVAGLFGMNMIASSITAVATDTIKAMEQRDVDAVRDQLVSSADDEATPERINAFAARIADELGSLQGGADNLLSMAQGIGELDGVQRRMLESLGGKPGSGMADWPVPATFDRADAVIYLRVDQARAANPSSPFDLTGGVVNVGVGTAAGFEAWLFDPASDLGQGRTTTSEPPSEPGSEASGASEQPGDG